jgi:3-oxoacyl-[acyl-carrier-protein] synthase II
VSVVVVTGLGAVSALGEGMDPLFERLCAGESGLVASERSAAPGPVGAVLPQRLRSSSELALAAVREALGAGGAGLDLRALAVVGASTSGDMALAEEPLAADYRGQLVDKVVCFLWPQLCHVPTAAVVRALGAEGPSWTVSTACTSGTTAVAAAGQLVAQGVVPAALAFGVDALCDLTLAGFGALKVYSPEPTRPFDLDRQGMNIGEGAGALLLEDLDHALARGARPLAVLAGSGNSADAHHLSTPDPTGAGARRAIRLALGSLAATVVGYVNAHATGTLLNDQMEAAALALELPGAAISGSKGALGHTLGAAGALEAAITVRALMEGRLPPNVGLLRPGFDLDLVRRTRETHIDAAMSVNFAFGGHNAALLFTTPGS